MKRLVAHGQPLATITSSVAAVPSPMTRRSSWLTTTTSSVATATTLSIPTTSPLMTTMVRPKCPLVPARGRAPRGAGVPIMLRLSDAQAAARASMILRSINIDNSHAQSQHLQRFVLVHLPRLRQDTEEHSCHKRPHASPQHVLEHAPFPCLQRKHRRGMTCARGVLRVACVLSGAFS